MEISGRMKVLIIGAGNIAQGFDDIYNDLIRTHIKGYRNFDDFFHVDTFFDTNEAKCESAALKWSVPNWVSNFSELKMNYYDVISICTPDDTHGNYLSKVIEMNPKVIFLEKPIGLPYKKADEIFELCEKKDILLLVNYSRLYLSEFQVIKQRIKDGEFGKILSISLKYHKGFYHNASHLINLLIYLIDPNFERAGITSVIKDYTVEDPSYSAFVNLTKDNQTISLTIEAFDASIINILELDIIAENGRVIYTESKGASVNEYTKIKYFDGMELKEYIHKGDYRIDYSHAMVNAIGSIKDYCTDQTINSLSQKELHLKTIDFMERICKAEFLMT
jgi:predicted dehydrogenase